MPTINEALAAVEKELAAIVAPAPVTKSMTHAEFIAYVQEQVALAKTDADPVARIDALRKQIDLAKNGWETSATIPVSVYSGDLSIDATSAAGERSEVSLSVPGPQSAPAAGAFESEGSMSGPAPTADARIMPPALPQSQPAAGAEGFMAKAEKVLAKAVDGNMLIAALRDELEDKPAPVIAKDSDGWPTDLARDTADVDAEGDFGFDPAGLGRGKLVM